MLTVLLSVDAFQVALQMVPVAWASVSRLRPSVLACVIWTASTAAVLGFVESASSAATT